jgi:sugar phosphate permease
MKFYNLDKSEKGLDFLNIFLADVSDGIGPYLGIFMLSVHHWSLSDIGVVTSVIAFSGVIAKTPAGALIDRWKNKFAYMTMGSGHFNLSNGVLATAIGLGAALSKLLAGQIAELYFIPIAFLFLSAIAIVGMLFFWCKMEETMQQINDKRTTL